MVPKKNCIPKSKLIHLLHNEYNLTDTFQRICLLTNHEIIIIKVWYIPKGSRLRYKFLISRNLSFNRENPKNIDKLFTPITKNFFRNSSGYKTENKWIRCLSENDQWVIIFVIRINKWIDLDYKGKIHKTILLSFIWWNLDSTLFRNTLVTLGPNLSFTPRGEKFGTDY